MKKKYYGIQILRFVAASFVVVAHACGNVLDNWPSSTELYNMLWPIGEIGVLVFFGISGFIMVITRYDSFGNYRNTLSFFSSRVVRIVPIYAIATSLQYINKINAGGAYNFLNYIKSLLFIPYIGDSNLYRPILGQGWTLNYEMFFYLIFGFSLFFKKIKGIPMCILFFVIVAAFDGLRIGDSDFLTFYANKILLYFVCGMIVALVVKYIDYSIEKLSIAFILIVTIMLSLVIGKHILSENLFFFISLLLVFFCVYISASCRPFKHEKFQALLERLGDASYSTYLFHGFVLGAGKIISNHIASGEYMLMFFFGMFAIIIANIAGFICYKYIETPISGYLHNKFFKKNKSPA